MKVTISIRDPKTSPPTTICQETTDVSEEGALAQAISAVIAQARQKVNRPLWDMAIDVRKPDDD